MAVRLVLDANLLVLLVIGDVDPNEIAVHKRAQSYSASDYTRLLGLIARYQTVATYPNILTEASNLIRQCPDGKKPLFSTALARFAQQALEEYPSSRRAVKHPAYARLGLTDAAILISLQDGDHLLTADLALYLAALKAELKAYNFNHLRHG